MPDPRSAASPDPAPAGTPAAAAIVMRPPRPGDLGWVVSRHGALYAAEYGWDARFEGMVAGIVARGIGLGRQLVREAMRFAREAGYREMVLWTNEVLTAARGIYVAEGFVLQRSERHESFGATLVGEYWSRPL